MTLLWDTDPNAYDNYRFVLGDGLEQHATSARISSALQERSDHALLVIGPSVDLAEACNLAHQERIYRRGLGIILIRRRLEVSLLTEAMRHGVREVVAAGDQNALAEAVARHHQLSSALNFGGEGVGNGQVVTVFSAKGGVGKTTIATNTATYLAATGSRTLLIDLDLMFGDVAICLQLAPTGSIGDLVGMRGHLDEQGLAAAVETHPVSGLDVLAAPTDPGVADRLPAEMLPELLRVARSSYRYVVIDTPPALTEHVLAAVDASNLILLIATLDIPALKNLKVAMSTLETLGCDASKMSLVLNRADAKVGLCPDDVETALGAPIAASVPSDMQVPASINRGQAIVLEQPKSGVAAAIREIADTHVRARLGDVPAAARGNGAKPAHRKSLIRGRR